MRRLVVMVCLGVLAGLAAGVRAGGPSQEPDPSPRPIRPGEWPTFKTGTRLATIDAVVVDDQGRQVTDLSPSDFEVVEHGKKPPVRQVVYLRTVPEGGKPADTVAAGPLPRIATAPRPRPLAAGGGLAARERTGRVLAIVVDDLGLSAESTAYVRRMLTRYVDTEVGPGDLVAIIRTAGGVGALQQFTTDRRLLHAAIDRVRWSLQSRSGVGAFAPFGRQSSAAADEVGKPPSLLQSPEGFRSELATAGTLGALEYIVRGIEALPGRKSVIFVSEGFDLGLKDAKVSRTWSAFTRMMDRANRAGVVVHTIEARGLQTAGLTAEDDPKPPLGSSVADMGPIIRESLRNRQRELMNTQESLVYLAQQTGGLAMLNTNDLSGALERILDDTRGYYLIGFETGISGGRPWDPNDVRIRVKRPGLQVRARRGLFGPADRNLPREAPPSDPLVAAALSPFSAGAIDVRLTTLFAHDPKEGSYVRTLFFIDPAGLEFVDWADGSKQAELTLFLMAVGDNGQSAGQVRRQLTLRLMPAAYAQLRQRGLLYSTRLPIADPGGYQIRAAVRDGRSGGVGSGAQFVEVPKVGDGEIALSGVMLMDVNGGDAAPKAPATEALAEDVLGEPAIKIFKPGAQVVYTCEIYDGRGGTSEGVSTTATLLRDGQPIFTSPPAPIARASGERVAGAFAAMPVGGRVSLDRQLAPGSYTLQVSVAPADAPARRRATQWAEFEVR